MVFSSHIFVYYFLPLALLGYYALGRAPQRWRNGWLILTGYTFYGWAEPRFMPLMFATTFVDWLVSLIIAHDTWRFWRVLHKPVKQLPHRGPRTPTQRRAILISVLLNLATLGFFKYFNFGIESYNSLVQAFGLQHAQFDTFFRVVLPLGISFYTFQALSYTIDVYRGEAEAMSNFIDFSCFVSMFPHLVAGPILKFSFLAEQLKYRRLTSDKFARGVAFFMLGLAKKILLANPCGKIADVAFNAGSVGTLDAWFGSLGYAFQIYFDFSGYSDMAIGLGLMFGFVFAKNFDSPYRSESITDFWRRWHISLSTWLREYLYVPLGGNRKGNAGTYINLVSDDVARRPLARRVVEFRHLGRVARRHAGVRAEPGSRGFLPQSAPASPHRVHVPHRLARLGLLPGRGSAARPRIFRQHVRVRPPPAGRPLARGGFFTNPITCSRSVVAALVVWAGKQTWDWTQRMTLPKTALCFALGWLALVVLATQEYNPFIYFIF